MDLSPRETNDLARFFARRFPSRQELDRLARAAGVDLADTLAGDAESVWSTVIVEASVQGRLRRLARTLAREDDSDENLQQVCDLILQTEPRPLAPVLATGGAVLLVLAGIAGALTLGGADETDAVAQAPGEAPAAETPAAEPPAAETPAAETPAADAAVPAVAAADSSDDATASNAPQGTATAAKAAGLVPAGSADDSAAADGTAAEETRRSCDGEPGEVVGYWYAGRTVPGSQGATITVPYSVNVRADYPDAHNDYDARTPVRCTLGEGTKLRLDQAPVQVPGDAYWVPLVVGSRID